MKLCTKLSTLAIATMSINAVASEIAPLDIALTFSQVENQSGQVETLLVTEDTDNQLKAINISQSYDLYPKDPMVFVKDFGYEQLQKLAQQDSYEWYSYEQLLPAGGLGNQHIAAGTNYPEHGEEANIDEVFLFPKYSQPTPAVSQVVTKDDYLIDYEVELCIRWSDDVSQIDDLNNYYAGVFICGDMSDRTALLRNLNVDDVASGHGFTDAKSGDDRFPTGPYMVVPKDWQSFVSDINIATYINGEQKQDAVTNEMIMNPTELVEWVLEVGNNKAWKDAGKDVPLITDNAIKADQALITGTAEGVIYNAPTTGYIIQKALKWLATFSFVESGPINYILEEQIREGLESKSYLQPGDTVHMTGTYLGKISIEMVGSESNLAKN